MRQKEVTHVAAVWKVRPLKFAVALRNEKVEAESTELEYMGLEHIESWTARRIEDESASSEGIATRFEKNDVLFGKLRPYLAKVYLAEYEGIATTEVLVLTSESVLEPAFLKYSLLSPKFIDAVSGASFGAKMPRANWETIGGLPILLPPRLEQQKIAAFLDWKTSQIDALIAKKQELLQKLKEKRLAVITQAVTKGLNPEAPMRDSGIAWLGEVPVHWEVKTLRRVISTMEQGWSPECENTIASADDWGVVKAGCCNGGVFDPEENKTLPSDLSPPENLEIRAGDLLMSRANGSEDFIGSVALVPADTRRKLILSDKTYRLRYESSVVPEFLAHTLQSPLTRFQILAAISGASGLARNIAQSDVKNFLLPTPPLTEQCLIANHLDIAMEKLATMQTKAKSAITHLTEYRSALITAATTGKIDVRNVKIPASP